MNTLDRPHQASTPKVVLVTGGAGFVGARLVPALLAEGHIVRVLDWYVFQEPRNDPSGRLVPIVGDLRDHETVLRSLEDVDVVIHLAAMSNDPSSLLDPEATRDINFRAACCLADRARERGVKRFINTSSASVYGVAAAERVTEELPVAPMTVYAQCKAESEEYILGLATSDFTVTSVRPATLSGWSPRLRLDLTVNILTHQAVGQGGMRVFGGDQFRPNLSIEDVVSSYLALVDVDDRLICGRTFNLCEGNYRVIEIAERIRDVLNRPDMRIERAETDDRRSYRLCADRARDELGLVPRHNLSHSIQQVASALLDGRVPNPDAAIHRNVEFLRGRDLRTPSAFLCARGPVV